MIYTIGHSTLSQEAFLELVVQSGIQTVMDVRSHPTSKWPQFRKIELEAWLPNNKIGYEWEPRLGGWDVQHAPFVEQMAMVHVDLKPYLLGKFPKQRIAKKTPTYPLLEGQISKPLWTNLGFYDYQYFMTIPEFFEGADALIKRGESEEVAIMCCELLPWRCHRSMIADYLVYRNVEVVHLQPKRKSHREMLGNRLERYELDVRAVWAAH